MQGACYKTLSFFFSCSLPFNYLFCLEEKGKGLEPAEINKQLTKLNLIDAFF